MQLPSYFLMGFGGHLSFFGPRGNRPGLALEVRGENLFNTKYQSVFGFVAPGRALRVGLRMAFDEESRK